MECQFRDLHAEDMFPEACSSFFDCARPADKGCTRMYAPEEVFFLHSYLGLSLLKKSFW
jgi:hypothetical protein